MAHEAVESKRALEDFERCHAALGYHAPTKRDKKSIEAAYTAVIKKYGSDFDEAYGWANQHIPKKNGRRLTLANLEEIAGKANMRSYYQLASYNVHASPKGLFFRLGFLGDFGIHSGASNAGLDEPGRNAAFTLVQLTALLFDPAKMNMDEIIQLSLLAQLRDRIVEEFEKAARKLYRDEAQYRRKWTFLKVKP